MITDSKRGKMFQNLQREIKRIEENRLKITSKIFNSVEKWVYI